jgi:hypothetical protein
MKSAFEVLAEMSPERRERILDRAEALIVAERRGRFAPETNRNAAATAACVVIGVVLGVGLLIAAVVF